MSDILERLRNTPNWQRESFEHWKTATLMYDRAPFEAADEIERLRAENAELLRQHGEAVEIAQRELAAAERLRAEVDALREAGESALRALRFYQDAHGVPPGSGYTALRAALAARQP